MATIKLAKEKKSTGAIATERDLMPAKVAQHIQEALEAGIELDRTYLVSDELYQL